MEPILTPRLALVQTPLDVLETRLVRDSFVAAVPVAGETVTVTFPPEWPGDALILLPMIIAGMKSDPDAIVWGGTVILRGENVAIGQMGCKDSPDAEGVIEIGYGLSELYWNRGYATEIVSSFVEWLSRRPEVTLIVAECGVENPGSIRVLEKSGFVCTGHREDEEDGPLIVWERRGHPGEG